MRSRLTYLKPRAFAIHQVRTHNHFSSNSLRDATQALAEEKEEMEKEFSDEMGGNKKVLTMPCHAMPCHAMPCHAMGGLHFHLGVVQLLRSRPVW